jgi:TonB family protein
LRKRPLAKQDPAFQQKIPELAKSEKLAVEDQRPQPIQRPDINKKPIISSVDVKNPQDKENPEEDLRSPFEAYQPEKRQVTSFIENSLEKDLVFGKRPLKETDRETTFSRSPFGSPSEISKKRLVGLSKENEDDQNRFGIFAGKKFELPQMKETLEDLSTKEKQEALAEELENARELETDDQIEGPIKGRVIVYRPQSPQVDVENEVEFKLKFWVLPDGTIGEVIPIKRGDTKLERIAIVYLKKWQFEPLSPEAPQRKIWGTIPIRFTVQ